MDCDPCPTGYWCLEEGMADYEISPCPVGFYCPEATWEPVTCPPGYLQVRMEILVGTLQS